MPRPALPKNYLNYHMSWAETLAHLTTVCQGDTPVMLHVWSRIKSGAGLGTRFVVRGHLSQGAVGPDVHTNIDADDTHRYTIATTPGGGPDAWLSFTERQFERGQLHTEDGNDYFWLDMLLADQHLRLQDLDS
jgi:hypothetical protein